jgi:YjbE family integral membrane protein
MRAFSCETRSHPRHKQYYEQAQLRAAVTLSGYNKLPCHRVQRQHSYRLEHINMELLQSTDFWLGLMLIIWINIILSGDNAVVIALAARSLPPEQQKKAIMFGSGAAVVLRIGLTVVAAKLMTLEYLQIVGGILLLWIGAQLLAGEDEDDGEGGEQSNLFSAIRTILIADLVMSLDNVIAVAAAAKGDEVLLMIGLAISIPLVIFGSTLMIKLMERYPVIITLGAALIGWVGGETVASDAVLREFNEANPWFHLTAAVAGAATVFAWGKFNQSRKHKTVEAE